MENIGRSNFLPVDNMAAGSHKSLDQSCRNYSIPGQNTSNGTCRLCFKGNCHLQELFPGGYTEELLISKIFECTTVEITFANDPDALICYSCVAKIEEFHRYREQCRSNDVQHKNSKRRLDDKMLTAPASTLIPAKYVKKEIDSEGFEISASDFYPLDVAEQSYGSLEASVDGPTVRIANASGTVDSTIPNEDVVRNCDEDENLLELMPEQRTHDEYSVSYTDMNEEYENNNEVFCELPIKEEPQDIDNDTDDWNDYGMEDDDTMDHSTNLIPLIDNCSYTTNSEHDSDEQRSYREVYNGADLVCLMQEGFLYVPVNRLQWRCRIKNCGAAIFQYEYRKELETNGINHAHSREVENTATDREILRLVENESPPPPQESDDESFRYVKNSRKGSSLIYKGYKYSMKHRNVDGTMYWKCRYNKNSCTAAIYQTPNNKFRTVGSHTHEKLDLDSLINTSQKPYVSSVSTEGDESLGDQTSPGKIKLRITRQTDATKSPSLKPASGVEEKNKLPIDQKDAQGVVRRSYSYKIEKNANGRIRLLFDGNQYVRESAKREASGMVVKWRCRRNYDMCGVSALQYEDGLVEVIGDHDHAPIKNTMSIPENSKGTTEYDLLPTFKGGEALLLDGYRYIKAYNKPNGMSLWRCTGLPGMTCRVKLILATNGVAYLLKNVKHDHDKPKRSRTMSANTPEVSAPIKPRDVNRDASVGKKAYRTGIIVSDTSSPLMVRRKLDKAMRKPIDSAGTGASSCIGQTAKTSSKLQHMRNYRVIRNKKGNKALVHGGYRYCKVRTRQDGIISWFCRMNKKTCRVGMYQYPDGRLEFINDSQHNHSQTDPTEPPKKVVPTVKKGPPYHMDDETFVNNEWYFVRNRKNGTTLIHAGYRYTKKGIRVDNTSMWRCSRSSQGCRAAIVMHCDETIAKFDDIDHNHSPPNSILDGETIISGDPNGSTEQSPNATIEDNATIAPELGLVNFNGCIEEQDDPEANMRTLLSTMLDVSDEPNNKSTDKILLPPSKANFRYVKNRRLTNSLVFRGYRYSRTNMVIRADGSVRWVCQMNKKTCRVSVRVLKDGSLEMDGQKHNHPQLPEDMEENCDNEDEDEGNDTTNVSASNTTFDNDSTIHQAHEMDKDAAHEYFFALNRSKGTSLIFQRNRYSKENIRPDGSSIWRCMVRSDCASKVILHADGTCVVYRNPIHQHPPLEELPEPLDYPDKFPSLPEKNQPVEKLPATKLNVKGDMLVYKQNRMKKVKSFSDGTAVFKCAEVDACSAKVKVQYVETDDGKSSSKVIFESPHSHQNFLTDTLSTGSSTRSASGKNKVESPLKLQRHSTTANVEHGKEYQLFRNDRGHVSLVYKGYRFSLRNHGVNGCTSWKCRANRTCSAHVTFTEDGRVVRTPGQVEAMPHNHAINGEFIERAVPLELDELHPPARNLNQFVSNWVNGLYKSMLGGKTKTALKPSISHNDGKKTIYHKNYSYKLQTIKNGREFWRCTMFKARACRAALFCSSDGTIIQHENGRDHNHEPIKPSATAMQQKNSARPSVKGKINDAAPLDAFYGANEAFHTINEVQKTVKRSHSSMHYDDRSVDEIAAPSYQIVEKDGVDILHHEKHRYVVILGKQEANTDEPKRWRCCLWNSRHQCPVELTVLESDEIHFETDPTHNHRPPPPESQEVDRVQVFNTKGTNKYELIGRNLKTVFYKGYKFFWKELRKNWTYYTCVCSVSHDCNATVKVDSNGLLYECSNESHNHSAILENDQSHGPTTLNQLTKPLSERALASKQARLASCSKTGSDDYRFVRSCVGNSMLFEGHRYWFHNKLSCGFHVYRCRYQKIKSCPGSVYMDMDKQLVYHRYDAEHNHEPEPEEGFTNFEKPASSLSTSETGNCALMPISPQLNRTSQSTDNVDERDRLTKAIESNEPRAMESDELRAIEGDEPRGFESDEPGTFESDEPRTIESDTSRAIESDEPRAIDSKPEVPESERDNEDDVIITPNYTFVKNYLNKNQLLYEDYVYEFVPLSYGNESDKFYSCLFSECSASVRLLPSGNLKVRKPNQHVHERPDLTDYRVVGRGSSNFTSLPPSGGTSTKTKILFESYMYYANVSQPFQDDTKVFHCYSNVSTKEKSKATERCSASLELLPNNCVIVTGTHHHPIPITPKLVGSRSREKSPAKLIVLDGRSYRYLNTHADGTVVWQCTDDPKCNAKVYGKPNGKLVSGSIKHVLRHVMPKLTQHSTDDLKTSLPASAGGIDIKSVAGSLIPSTSNSIVPISATGSLRTKWYQGNKYNFYLTRRDGVQVWRCSKRIEEICDAGILCYPSGTVLPYNDTPHTHPTLKAATDELRDEIPPKGVEKLESANNEVVGNVSKYPLLNTATTDVPNNLFVTYKGVQYMLRKRSSDGIRIYRCRNKPCMRTLLVDKRGKILSKKTTWHSCENQPDPDELVPAAATTKSNTFSSRTSGPGFDKPEIEDPDDLVDQNESTTMEPLLKRIRLDIEMVETKGQKTASRKAESTVQTEDSLSAILNTETDSVVEEDLIEEGYVDMQHGLNTGNDATDPWEQEYLEQEFQSSETIDNNGAADSDTEDRRPADDNEDNTHDK